MKRLVLGCEERTRQIDQLKSESENKGIQIQVYVPQWVNKVAEVFFLTCIAAIETGRVLFDENSGGFV